MQVLYRAIHTIDNINKYIIYIKITNYQKSEINVMLKILMECREQEVNEVKKKRLIALILCLCMVFSSALSVSAAEISGTDADTEVTQEVEKTGDDKQSEDVTEEDKTEPVAEPGTVDAAEEPTAQGADEIDASVWKVEDFTYTYYEKRLYGCDYSRDFTIKGSAIAGFSESGLAKLEKNKDLVLPATDDEGDAVVGVAPSAFAKKGLTSVQFPTGMMVDYNDTVTNGKVTKRGNFVIGENAFSGNELTSVTLPEGVIACLSNSFMNNKITTVKLPKTIWWLETQSFGKNLITTVNFPTTCDFQLEMHGMAFANNLITSVRLPDYTEVVNKDSFFWNPGKEPLANEAPDKYKSYKGADGKTHTAGIVYMYADNAEFEVKDRIHHDKKETESQHSWVQRLIINDGSEETENPDLPWNVNDFTFEGQTVTGLSESGIAKRATNKDLVIPDFTSEGTYVTAIADAKAGGNGLFASATEGFDTVYLPVGLQKVGSFAFQANGLKEVTFPSKLAEIGATAFQNNNLTSVILPDTVTTLGNGAFATNPSLERINLSKGLTEIPDAAFGCSDAKHYMTNLKSIVIPEGITKIGRNAFAGNNFSAINIPSTVTEIGAYAFSTKNYLSDPCVVSLPEGLTTIGDSAFRNKVISEINLPTTVIKLNKNTFRKEYSDDTQALVTKVYVISKEQYEDTKNFPASDYHKLYLKDDSVWTAEDFTYGDQEFCLWPADAYVSENNFKVHVVTGLSEQGTAKLEVNKNLVIPAKDSDGKKIQGIGDRAFYKKGITTLTLPENVKAPCDPSTWQEGQGITERGDFFIGASAFLGNELTSLDLPEGVICVGGNAFKLNKLTTVKFPKTVMQISNQSFAQNAIVSLDFSDKTDYPLQIDSMAFGMNKVMAVRLPANTSKLDKNTFMNKDKVVVNVYIDTDNLGSKVTKTSTYHKVIQQGIPEEEAPWGVNDFTYDEAGTTITGFSDSGAKKIKTNPYIILPKEGPDGKAITALGAGANNQGIFVVSADGKNYTPASVILPDTLKTIGNFAFALNGTVTYESVMASITFPEGLEEIGATAFQNSKLTAVSIPDSVTTMGNATFTGSQELQAIKLSANVKDIPASAFMNGGTSLSEFGTLVVPEGVVSIGKSAFAGRHVKEIVLPSTLETIGDQAFENHQLTKLTLPANVKTIGKRAFRVLQEGLNHTLSSVNLNEGLKTIGQEAFVGSVITEVELPSTVTLSHANKSADLIFGTSKAAANPIVKVKVADKTKAEEWNTTLANQKSHIVVYDKLVGSGWTAEDFTYDGTTITGWSESGQLKRQTIRTLVLPDQTPDGQEITAIGEAAFKIPDAEVEITKFGVNSPNGMTSVVLPEKATVIGKEAFSQNALVRVDFTGITSIGGSAFYGNDLVEAILPDTVTELGDGAFSANDITEVRLSSGVTVIPAGAFSMNIRLDHVTIPNTVTEIGQTAFAGARLTSLEIPNSVTKIGMKAFHLHHLSSLVIPGSVKEIGESAFEGTYKATTLKTLVLEEGVESIGKFAFKEALLETVAFPNSITTVGAQPFRNNKGKDGSHVVEVTTTNKEHRKLTDDTYVINYTGKIGLDEVEDKVTVEFDKADYTGKEIKPTVTIEGLKEGTDFEVSYTDNVELGVGHVIIKGIGKYEGTLNKTFKIVASDKANVVVKPSAPSTKADDFDKDSIKKDVLTDEEKAQVEAGEKANVYLEVTKLEESAVPAEDIVKTNAKAAEIEGIKKGLYLDISMWKVIGDSEPEKVTGAELSKKVKISVELPENLIAPKGKTRTYYVIRVHDGVAEILPTTLNGKTITFETDRFSTYSIWYTEQDVKGTAGGTGDKGNGGAGTTDGKNDGNNKKPADAKKAAKTGDYNHIGLLCLLLAMSVVVTGGTVVYKRRKNR